MTASANKAIAGALMMVLRSRPRSAHVKALAMGTSTTTKPRALDLLRHGAWLLAAIMLLAAALRAFNIGAASLWNDELFSRYYAQLGSRFMWTQGFSLETTPPTYYTLLVGWMRAFGTSEAAMRSLSLVASVATVPLVYLLAREFAAVGVALLAALLFALSPMQVYFAQEARAYALMLLPVGLALLGMARFLREPRATRHLVLYGVGAALAVYVHTTSILLVAALNLAFFAGDRSRVGWRGLWHWVAANAVVALLCVPEALAMLREVGANRLSWMRPVNAHDILLSLGVLVTGPATHPGKLSIGLGLLALAALAVAVWRMRPERRALAVLVVAPVFDFALILLAGLRQPILVPRVLCWMWLPLSVLLACSLSRRGAMRPALAGLFAVALVVGLGFQLGQGDRAKEPWRPLLARLRPELATADLVVVGPWTQPMGLAAYGQDLGRARHWTEGFPPTVESTVIARQIGVREISRDALITAIREGRRVLLIQREFEYSFQPLLSGVAAPQTIVKQDCGASDCLEALYWSPAAASPPRQPAPT